MSVKVTTDVWENAPLEGSRLLVLLALADWASDEGKCWPHIGTLARRARISESQTYRILAELEQLGFLEKPTGRRSANKPFTVLFSHGREGRTDARSNLAPMRGSRAGDTKKEPSKEPSIDAIHSFWCELRRQSMPLTPGRRKTIEKLLREEPEVAVLHRALAGYAAHAERRGRTEWEVSDAFSTFQGRDADNRPVFGDLRSRLNWLLSIEPERMSAQALSAVELERVMVEAGVDPDKGRRWLDEVRQAVLGIEVERGKTSLAKLRSYDLKVIRLSEEPWARIER